MLSLRIEHEVEVNGPAGASRVPDGSPDHNGEFVYVGTGPDNVTDHLPIDGYDRTRNIRTNHIDNSAGYPHSHSPFARLSQRTLPSSTVPTRWDPNTATRLTILPRSGVMGIGNTFRGNAIRAPAAMPSRLRARFLLTIATATKIIESPKRNSKLEWERKMRCTGTSSPNTRIKHPGSHQPIECFRSMTGANPRTSRSSVGI